MSEPQTKPRTIQRMLLVGSLALNLLILGIIGGVALNFDKSGGPQRFDLTAGPLTRAMDADRRAAVRDALQASGAFARGDRSGMRQDMEALLASLRADEFDEAVFREALMRQRTRLQSGQAAVLDALATQIADMATDERAAFADRLQEQTRRGPPRQRRDGG